MGKRRLLIIFAFSIILIIILLVFVTQRNYSPYDPETGKFEENITEVFNQGSDFLQYENDLYFVDRQTSSIIKYNTKDNVSRSIIRMSDYGIGDKLYIISNKLIFNVGNNTYYSDLDGQKVSKFLSGNILYINDDVYIYILNDNSAQHLYITSYDNATFYRTNELFFNLANGYKIRYLKQIGDVLFFESRNTDNSLTLFSIDLKEFKTKIINNRQEIEKTDYVYSEFADIAMSENNLYFSFSNIEKTTDGEEGVISNEIYFQELNYGVSDFLVSNVEKNLYIVKNEDNLEVVYEKYNELTQKYELYSVSNELVSYNWEDVVFGETGKYFSYDNSIIYKENLEFIALNSEYFDYEIKSVRHYENYYYILLSNDLGSHVWFGCDEKGSELKKIYEWKEF